MKRKLTVHLCVQVASVDLSMYILHSLSYFCCFRWHLYSLDGGWDSGARFPWAAGEEVAGAAINTGWTEAAYSVGNDCSLLTTYLPTSCLLAHSFAPSYFHNVIIACKLSGSWTAIWLLCVLIPNCPLLQQPHSSTLVCLKFELPPRHRSCRGLVMYKLRFATTQ